jgi:hypothetical protein
MISAILMIAAGILKAFLDISAHGKPFWFMENKMDSKYDWFYSDRSWGFKWKPLKELGEKPVELFLGSSTVFVFLTDGWHLFQFFFLNTLILAIVLYEPLINWWADFMIYAVVMKTVFQLCYGRLLVKS